MKISRRSWHYRYLLWLAQGWESPPFAVLVSPILLVVLGLDWLRERRARHRGVVPRALEEPAAPSLLGSWIRAKKAKVCPRLECTALEAFRDAWVHHYIMVLDQRRVIWNTWKLARLFERLLYHRRGWHLLEDEAPELDKLRASVRLAAGRLRAALDGA